ncbi:MAG TPA: Type 1 glutamine amidotransferase-like domain-containing protein [Gemmatimonadales bacterium]
MIGLLLLLQVVGPPRGTVVVVGGGAIGPEVYSRFIAAAGGPDALIIDVPTAGGDSTYPADWRGADALRKAGARNVRILHTIYRNVANSDSFVAPLATAGGVWFEGGRQWHLVDSYAGTRTEAAFHEVLARGGVVGGSSAGASILSSYLLRGARSGNAIIMAPGYEKGFGFLRGTAIDQHVVARERLKDLADSLVPAHPELLAISEDEGTAWVVRGDTAEIVGRNKAFAYNGKAGDPGKPFLTLFPGDRYNLATREVISRAIAATALTEAFVDSVMAPCGPARCTVLVARDGKVLLAKGYNIPPHPKYQPATTVPGFALGGVGAALSALLSQVKGADSGSAQAVLSRRILMPIGARRTTPDSGNVDELYRLELGLQYPATWSRDSASTDGAEPAPVDPTLGWNREALNGVARLSLYGTPDGKRNAFVRLPEPRIAVIILTDQDDLDARLIAENIVGRLVRPGR